MRFSFKLCYDSIHFLRKFDAIYGKIELLIKSYYPYFVAIREFTKAECCWWSIYKIENSNSQIHWRN